MYFQELSDEEYDFSTTKAYVPPYSSYQSLDTSQVNWSEEKAYVPPYSRYQSLDTSRVNRSEEKAYVPPYSPYKSLDTSRVNRSEEKAYVPPYSPYKSLDTPKFNGLEEVKEFYSSFEPLSNPLSPDGSLMFTHIFKVGITEEEESEGRSRREESPVHAEPVSASPHPSEDSKSWIKTVTIQSKEMSESKKRKKDKKHFATERHIVERTRSESDGNRSKEKIESMKKFDNEKEKKKKKKMEQRLLKKIKHKCDRKKRRSSDEWTKETNNEKKSVNEAFNNAEKEKEMERLHLATKTKHVFKKPAPPPKRPVPRATNFLKEYKIPKLQRENTTPEFPIPKVQRENTTPPEFSIPKVQRENTTPPEFSIPKVQRENTTPKFPKTLVKSTPSKISKEGEEKEINVVVFDVLTKKTAFEKIDEKEEDVLFLHPDPEEYEQFWKDEQKLEKLMGKYYNQMRNKNRFLYY